MFASVRESIIRESMLTEHEHCQYRCQGFFCWWSCGLHSFLCHCSQVLNPSYLHIVALGEGQLRELCALGPDLLHPRICHLINEEKRNKVSMHMIGVTQHVPHYTLDVHTHTYTHTRPHTHVHTHTRHHGLFFPVPSLVVTWSHRARVRRSM